MSDLLAEVEDSFREEKIAAFWSQYGKFIIGVVLITILGTASVSGYNTWERSSRIEGTNQLLSLMDSPDFPGNMESEDLALPANLKGIALLTAAARFMDDNKPDNALGLYARVANDTGISPEFRHLGQLMLARLNIQNGDVPTADIISSLEPITQDNQSPWRHHAKIELASLHAAKEQNYDQALSLLNDVRGTQGLPQTMYSRVDDLIHAYTLASAKPANPETQTPNENGS